MDTCTVIEHSIESDDDRGVAGSGPTDCAAEIRAFESHGLSDLNNAELMDRVDTKFVLPRALLPDLLDSMQADYSMLEIEGKRCFRYLNGYYDTDDYSFYAAHHNGKLNRYKVRCRTYVDSGTSYLEVKFKNNRMRTNKRRIKVSSASQAITPTSLGFMRDCGLERPSDLVKVQLSGYQRIALANEEKGERLTIDLNLDFNDTHRHKSHWNIGPWIVVELKQGNHNRRSAFFQWAKLHRIRPCSFSKYCMGVYHTADKRLKRNLFHKIARPLAEHASLNLN